MGTVEMFDSTVAANLPNTALAVAAYVDGRWPDYDAAVARCPRAAHISITVEGAPGARVLDWERGNADPPKWAGDEISAGRRPTIYCDRSSLTVVSAHIAPLRLGAEVDNWLADWGTTNAGTPHLAPGTVATQYAHDVGGVDISLALPSWLGGTLEPDPVDTGTHYDALVPGYGLPGTPELAVIGQMLGGGLYRGRNVAGGAAVYAGTGNPTRWATGFNALQLPPGTPLAVGLAAEGQTTTVVVTERL